MIKLLMLTPDQKVAEIKRLYFTTSRETITEDFAKALDLLKSLATEEERQRAAVFMDGLAEMRSDWRKNKNANKKGKGQTAKGRR